MWVTPSVGNLYKGCGRKLVLFACLLSLYQVHSLTNITAYFFGILLYTEDHLRHPVSWTEQLDSWTSHSSAVIVGIAGTQSAGHSNKTPLGDRQADRFIL